MIPILQSDLPKANAQCVICSRKYYVCEKCIKLHYNGIESWRLFCDSPKCYEAYVILQDYNNGSESKDATLERIADYNIDKELLNEEMSAIYSKLTTEEEKKEENKADAKVEVKPVKQYGYTEFNKNNNKKNKNKGKK